MQNNPLVQEKDRIYYIDLLRAIAIMLVVLGHAVFAYGAPPSLSPLQLGGTGVDLFFLLSGWLIGSQLFKEHQRFGNIDVKRFWIRRWMRTLPAYYVVLFITLAQLYLTKDNVASPIPHLFFFQNYTDSTYFTISWSLALEEQFYLVIAPTILFLQRFKRSTQTGLLLFILAWPSVFRYLGWYDSLDETHVRWDCCLMGVLLANIYYQYPEIWKKIKPFSTHLVTICIFFYVSFFWSRWFPDYAISSDPSPLILAFVFAGLVIYAVNRPVKKLPFAHKLIMHVSTRSYAMYLLHVEALSVAKRLVPDSYFLVFFALTLVITMILSEVLFRYIEQPFIRKRGEFTFSQSREK
jgi:peptidoglycan/LPS O-acetylase OafA/YrhL